MLRPMHCPICQVLERDGGNLKALYRRAQAYLATGDFLEAEQDIRKALIEVRVGRDGAGWGGAARAWQDGVGWRWIGGMGEGRLWGGGAGGLLLLLPG